MRLRWDVSLLDLLIVVCPAGRIWRVPTVHVGSRILAHLMGSWRYGTPENNWFFLTNLFGMETVRMHFRDGTRDKFCSCFVALL